MFKEITMADENKGIEILFEDESLQDLSEDFKTKATVIFNTAVAKAVVEEKRILEESFDDRLEEEKKEVITELEEQIDSYLTYVAEEWMKENELSVESGIKVEIAEHFMQGMKDLFEESYVEVPESEIDVVAEMAEQLTVHEKALDEVLKTNIMMESEIKRYKKAEIILEETDKLADSEVDKIKSFVEMIEFEDDDSYRSQVKSIVDAYYNVNDGDDKNDDDNEKGKKKKKNKDKEPDEDDMEESVNLYVNAISKGSKF